MLAEYERPPLDEAIEAELNEWVAQRKASFPDSDV
jgi:trimethylamine:corrinoid methyltransferase-like protein